MLFYRKREDVLSQKLASGVAHRDVKQRPGCCESVLGLKGSNKILVTSRGWLWTVSAQVHQHQTCVPADEHSTAKACTSSLGKAVCLFPAGRAGKRDRHIRALTL